jgi:hypothetical protein
MTLIPELEEQLLALAQRQASVGSRRSRRRMGLVAVAWGLVATTVALAAGGVIPIGSPVRDRSAGHTRPDAGSGVVVAGSAKLLGLRINDPAGGPPWGMRIVSTTRGLGCLQVGRVVGGRLGVLGQDGLFGNDGRFHPLVSGMSGISTCGELDTNGRLFTTGLAGGVPAAGMADGACLDPYNTRGAPAAKLCAGTDERNIYFGTLGPQADQLTYANPAGSTTTVPMAAPHGAYLIVTRLNGRHDDCNCLAGGGVVEPLNTPITQLRFRTGLTCRIVEHGFANGPRSCPIPGYAPRSAPPLATRDVATPVHARVLRNNGHTSIVVSFRARLAVTDAHSAYTITLHAPHVTNRFTADPIDRNVRVGEKVTLRFQHLQRHGRYTGSVIYLPATGPAPPGQRPSPELTVGRWSVRVP